LKIFKVFRNVIGYKLNLVTNNLYICPKKTYMLFDIGGRIKFLLKINNDKASNLARAINVSPAVLSRLINANKIPKIKGVLENIRDYFKTDDEWFESGILLDFLHECNYQFKEEDSTCPYCGGKITDYIHPSIKLHEYDFSFNLRYKLNHLMECRNLLFRIDEELNKIKDLKPVSFENIELIDKILDIKGKTVSKISVLGLECDEMVRIETLEKCPNELDLACFLDESYWDVRYAIPNFVLQSEKLHVQVPLK
jgi:hypothetical protein